MKDNIYIYIFFFKGISTHKFPLVAFFFVCKVSYFILMTVFCCPSCNA